MSGVLRTLRTGNPDKIANNFADGVLARYQTALAAAGGSISATQLAAVRTFVKTGFRDRWWFSLVDCCLFLGADLTSGLVKIVAAPGAGASYVAHGVLSGDYGVNSGVTVAAINRYMSSGVVPTDQGLSTYNLTLVAGAVGPVNAVGTWGCDEPDGAKIAFGAGLLFASHGIRSAAVVWGASYSIAAGFMPTYMIGALDGIRTFDQFGGSFDDGTTFNNQIEIFRTTKFGTQYTVNAANIGFFAVGKMMTEPQLRSISAAVTRLHRSARSITTSRYVFMGDSITYGQGVTPDTRYSSMVAVNKGVLEVNTGIAGTEMISNGNGLAGRNRYRGTEQFPIHTFFCMLGSNDISIEDATTNGDSAVIALYRSYLVTMANVLKGQGARVVILSIPWTTRGNETKVLAWVDGALGAATDAGVIGIDIARPMIASGDPQQYLGDSVHPNTLGHQFIRDLILAAI